MKQSRLLIERCAEPSLTYRHLVLEELLTYDKANRSVMKAHDYDGVQVASRRKYGKLYDNMSSLNIAQIQLGY